MKISQLALRGIAGLPDMDVDLMSGAAKPHDLVIVTGHEASGKTRLLELMVAGLEAIGPYEGIVRSSDWVGSPQATARLELGIWLAETEREAAESANPVRAVVGFGPDGVTCVVPRGVKRLLSRYDHDTSHGKREYFPETRQRAWGGRRDGLGTLEQSLWRSSKDPQKYSFIPRFLTELDREPERRRAFAQGLEHLSPSVRYTPESSQGEFTLRGITERGCFTTGGNPSIFFSELSSSEANAVLIAATAAMIGLGHSIVFLDRPELYVEPGRLVAWVHALASLGRDNQWIVASGSDRLAEAVHATQVVSLHPRSDA